MARWRKVWIREYRGKRGTTYRVSCYDTQAQARRTIRTFHSKHESRAFRNEYEAFLNGEGPKPGTPVEGRKARKQAQLWSEATAAWIESGATRPKTRSHYKGLLGYFGKQAGVICVEDVTELTVSDFLSRLKRQDRSLSTCSAYLRTLATFFRWACPADSPITPRLINRWAPYKKRRRARPHYFTSSEYDTMISACDSIVVRQAEHRSSLWWKTFIGILYYAGLRFNETAHLIWRDIDFDKGVLRIQPHIGLKGVLVWRPKGKARRSVPIPSEVTDLLIRMQHDQENGIPYVFLSSTRYRHLIKQDVLQREILYGIGKSFKQTRDLAGVCEGTIHDMRRTCITNWTKHPGFTPKDVQILAGHEDLNTTLEIYTMVEEEDVVEKARQLIRQTEHAI